MDQYAKAVRHAGYGDRVGGRLQGQARLVDPGQQRGWRDDDAMQFIDQLLGARTAASGS